MSLNLTCLVYVSCRHVRCVHSKGQTDPTVLEALSRRQPWSHLASGQDTSHSQLSLSWHCHAITVYTLYRVVQYIHNLQQKIKNCKKKNCPDVNWEQRHSLGGLQEVQACCSLLPPTSTQVWLQQAKTLSTFQDTLLTPQRRWRAKRSKGLVAKLAALQEAFQKALTRSRKDTERRVKFWRDAKSFAPAAARGVCV